MESVLQFIKSLMPSNQDVIIISTSEANALLNNIRTTAEIMDIQLIAIPIEQSRDIAMKIKLILFI